MGFSKDGGRGQSRGRVGVKDGERGIYLFVCRFSDAGFGGRRRGWRC